MKICAHCGYPNFQMASVCQSCGKKLPKTAVRKAASSCDASTDSLDETRTIWIQEQMLGTVQILDHHDQKIRYRLPAEIDDHVTLRFKGHGRTVNERTGNLLLTVRVDRGLDVTGVLWLAESEAALGCGKTLFVGGKRRTIAIPKLSRNGQVVRVVGQGDQTPDQSGLPLVGRKTGDLRATLRTFPDSITPSYGSVEAMSTEHLNLEGWIYRRIDFVMERMDLDNRDRFRIRPVTAKDVATLFNEGGWPALARMLVARLDLSAAEIDFKSSKDLSVPGQCSRSSQKNSLGRICCGYNISIHKDFLDDPFAIVAILAHELCHVIHSRCLAPSEDYVSKPGAELLEEERTVDLLVFMFQLGEFQMRIARARQRTLGYFDQPLFERMAAILNRKRQAWQ